MMVLRVVPLSSLPNRRPLPLRSIAIKSLLPSLIDALFCVPLRLLFVSCTIHPTWSKDLKLVVGKCFDDSRGSRSSEATEQNGLSEGLHTTALAMTLHLKHVYSKEFLLSIAELEECKRVPAGLDSSLLRETQSKLDEKGVAIPGASSRGLIRTMRENDACSESPPDVPEWRRPCSLPGSPFLKPGPRQAEPKISSPRPGPARAGNSARSIMGRSGSARWELRSNGEDRDRDVNRNPFEWELSSPTESVVSQEHDGLLGSGGPIVHRGMIQTTPTHDRHRAEKTTRIGRTGEQYHSTRGGKVSRNYPSAQNSRREDTDSISDETFGSDDWPHGERSEQERQRRDQFEQMRKELRKKPLNTVRSHNDTWLGEGSQSTETFVSSSPGTPQSSSSKDDILKPHNKSVTTSSAPRLLVPPGFSKPTLSKLGSPKENLEVGQSFSSQVKDDEIDALKHTSSTDEVKMRNEDHFSSLLMKLNQLEDENQKTFSPSQSPMMSKFARWFPSQGPKLDESSSNSEPLNVVTVKEDSGLSPDFSSAKHELAGSSENMLASKVNPVTSLMPTKSNGSVLPMPVGPSLEDVEKVMTAGADFGQDLISAEDFKMKNHVPLDRHLLSDSNDAVMNDAAQNLDSQEPPRKNIPGKKNPPVFLTCEDLEQSLLSELVDTGSHTRMEDKQVDMDNNVNLMKLLQMGPSRREVRNKEQGWVAEQESENMMDGSASTHLMLLLQKNAGRASPLEDSTSIMSTETSAQSMGQKDHVEDQSNTAEIISLETLFGRKFVNELRAVGEPVSSKQIVDDSIHVGNEGSLLNSVLSNKSHARKPGHADVPFQEQAGWNYDGLVVTEQKGLETTSRSDLQDLQGDLLTDVSVHHHSPMKASKNTPSSRGVSINGASFGDFSHNKFSHHPYQGSHRQQLEGHRRPPSEISSQRLQLEPMHEPHLIHENSLYATGTYRVLPSVSAGYPESIQMGFNPSQCMPDPRITGPRISPLADRWFPGNHVQGSQGIAGVNPYQHQMIQERKPGLGISGLGLGPGVENYNF
ncbi:hypothetical protein GOP47_0003669 [Adiantum capillus-veneris]|uniref:Uncharacterized protein n=1 Tax=Adiantum capillus-veneris TaxID=13818 RepID=A0A9D4ZP12_ADICA|nr:hypothetical protein GOP47_0003669 [Adiantum capillus-veneris]